MIDIFYFNKDEVSVDDFIQVANNLNVLKTDKFNENSIVIYFDNDTRWEINKFDIENDLPEPDDINFLKEKGIKVLYCIGHRSSHKTKIITYWKSVLNEFGGWLGNDDNFFEPVFNKDTIDNFKYNFE